MNRDLLLGYGIDCERGLKNCMGNPEFYKKILSMFQQDTCFQRALAAHTAKDYRLLFSCIHELKGMSGNAALTALYDATIPLADLLRHETCADAQVDKLFAAVSAEYYRTYEGIAHIIAEA